jgi:hypothetical protein
VNVFLSGYGSIFASICTTCPSGYLSNTTNQATCTTCNAGYITNANLGATACVACDAGYYSNATATIACTACVAGYYNAMSGATACVACVIPTYALASPPSSNQGVLMRRNVYVHNSYSTNAATSCLLCAAGYQLYTNTSGITGCVTNPLITPMTLSINGGAKTNTGLLTRTYGGDTIEFDITHPLKTVTISPTSFIVTIYQSYQGMYMLR